MRGHRKCGTCVCFEPLPDIYRKHGCKLPVCECETQDKQFGIALCPNYIGQRFLDTSGAHADGGVNGFCRWRGPPVLDRVLWGKGGNVQRNSESSWCHCWQPIPALHEIDGRIIALTVADRPLIENG